MNRFQLVVALTIVNSLSPDFSESAQAQQSPSEANRVSVVQPLTITEFQQHHPSATTVKEWLVQVEAAKEQVTNVQLNRTKTGLEIVLVTRTGKPLTIDATQFRTEGNSLIATIPDAILMLPGVEEYIANDPTDDIASVRVTQVNASSIQIAVVGQTTLPTSEVILRIGELAYSLNPDSKDDVELIVTGNRQTGYLVPNASTATGTNTLIIETPFSIQVVPQEVIRDQQVIQIQDALTNVSGVNFAGSNGGREASFSIRGFGNQFGNSVPLLRDGYRLYGTFQAIPEVANLERIEVLKGPSSILYGQMEPGGIINLVSKKPLPNPFREAELQVGSFDLVRPRIDISGPLTDSGNLLYRLNALYKYERSFRDFDTPQNRASTAPALAWKIGDRTELLMNLEYIYQNSFADFGITKFGSGVAPIPRERVINNPDDSVTTNYLSLGYGLDHQLNENWKLRNGFRYIRYTYDYSVIALPLIVQNEFVTRFYAQQEGQDNSYSLYSNVIGNIKTGSIKHIINTGVDLNHTQSRIATLFDLANPSTIDIFDPDYNFVPKPLQSNLSPFSDTNTTEDKLGIYLQDQIYLLKNLILVAGIRYDTVTTKTTNIQTAFSSASESNQSDDAFTPRFGLLYRPIEQLALFANYSQSFNPNSATNVSGEILPPQRGSGFEVGVKTELLNQKLQATLTYFNITLQNVPVADPAFPLFSIAVGEQKSQGVEIDLTGEILPGWKVIGSYAYINAKVTNDANPNFIDNVLFGVPRHAINLWTTYEIQSGRWKGLGFGAGLNYVSNRYGDLANSYQIGDYLIGNAAVFYRWNRYRFAINARNLSNAYYIRAVTGNDGGIEPGEPLTIIGSFSFNF